MWVDCYPNMWVYDLPRMYWHAGSTLGTWRNCVKTCSAAALVAGTWNGSCQPFLLDSLYYMECTWKSEQASSNCLWMTAFSGSCALSMIKCWKKKRRKKKESRRTNFFFCACWLSVTPCSSHIQICPPPNLQLTLYTAKAIEIYSLSII